MMLETVVVCVEASLSYCSLVIITTVCWIMLEAVAMCYIDLLPLQDDTGAVTCVTLTS